MVGRSWVVTAASAWTGYSSGSPLEPQQPVREHRGGGQTLPHIVLDRAEVLADHERRRPGALSRATMSRSSPCGKRT